MTSRVQTFIDSELRRLAPRRGMLQQQVGMILVLLLLTAEVAITGGQGIPIMASRGLGVMYAGAVLLVQAGFLIWGIALLSFEESGTVQREILQLIRLSGLTERQWLAARLGTIAPLLAVNAALALPFLALAPSLEGVSWSGIAMAEAVIVSHAAMLLTLGLFQSTRLDVKGRLGNLLGIEFLVEVIVPAVVRLVIELLERGPLRHGLEAVTILVTRSTGIRAIEGALTGMLMPGQLELACAVPLGLAWLFGRVVVTRLYAPSADEQSLPDPAALAEIPETPLSEPVVRAEPVAEVSGPVSRPSERCWDDALAWHEVFFMAGRGGTPAARSLLVGKSVIYGLVIVGAILFELSGRPPWEGIATNIAAAFVGLLVLAGVAYPVTSFHRELEDRMMELLLLTPHDGLDFYDGWSRGARRLQYPELVTALLLVGVLLGTRTPAFSAVAAAVFTGLLMLGPILAFGALLPSGLAGVAGVLLLLAFVAASAFAAAAAGVALTPWAAAPIVGILLWSLGRLCRRGIDRRLRTEYEERDRREP